VSYTNASDLVVFPTLRYKLTHGDLVFTTLQVDTGDTLSGSYDMTGVDQVDLVIDGVTVATYRNTDKSRLSGTPALREPFSATLTRDASAKDGSLSLTLTNTPAAYSDYFTLSVGEGTDIYQGRTFLYTQNVVVPRIPRDGTPVSRTVTVPSGQPLWAAAYFEVQSPILQYLAERRILLPQVAPDDLKPVGRPDSVPEFVADVSPREAAARTTVSVTAAGLSPHEAFSVRLGGRVVGSGRASATGFAQDFVHVPHGSARAMSVQVTGDRPSRTGETELRLIR
jgi:hypothetical protein